MLAQIIIDIRTVVRNKKMFIVSLKAQEYGLQGMGMDMGRGGNGPRHGGGGCGARG